MSLTFHISTRSTNGQVGFYAVWSGCCCWDTWWSLETTSTGLSPCLPVFHLRCSVFLESLSSKTWTWDRYTQSMIKMVISLPMVQQSYLQMISNCQQLPPGLDGQFLWQIEPGHCTCHLTGSSANLWHQAYPDAANQPLCSSNIIMSRLETYDLVDGFELRPSSVHPMTLKLKSRSSFEFGRLVGHWLQLQDDTPRMMHQQHTHRGSSQKCQLKTNNTPWTEDLPNNANQG